MIALASMFIGWRRSGRNSSLRLFRPRLENRKSETEADEGDVRKRSDRNTDMNEQKISRTIEILNPEGMHARPADLFAKCAGRFDSTVTVVKSDGERIDGKSILSLLTLAAVQGTQLQIEASGDDAAKAVEALGELVDSGFDASKLDLGSAT